MENLKNCLKYIIAPAILLFISLNNIFPNIEVLDLIDIVVTIVILVFVFYIKYLWRFNPFEKIPKIFGTYDVKFVSTHDKKIRKMKMVINQTLYQTKIKIITEESESVSIVSNIKKINGEWKLIYTYENIPKMLERKHSNIHYGTCILSIENKKISSGYYYTDRNTKGDITFNLIK